MMENLNKVRIKHLMEGDIIFYAGYKRKVLSVGDKFIRIARLNNNGHPIVQLDKQAMAFVEYLGNKEDGDEIER